MIVYCGGEFLPEERAAVSIDDRGLLFGDGVFETALLFNGGFFRLRQHLDRFAASAATLRIAAPPRAELDGMVRALARANGLRDANIRITLTRGVREPLLFATARPPDEARAHRLRAGWSLVTAAARRPSTAAIPAQLKALGRTYAILARHEAADARVDDALLLNDDGFICEGPTWNIFWRIGVALYTPALSAGVLAGVTRTVLLEAAPDAGFTVWEGLWHRTALDEADEVFATMTSVGIVHIHTIDGRVLPQQTPAADALRLAYQRILAAEVLRDPL